MEKENVIGFLSGSLGWGGLEMNQLRYAVWMKNRGHSVLIFSRKESTLAKAALKEGIKVVFIKAHRKYYDFSKANALRRLIKKNQVSHLIVRDPRDMGLSALTKTLLKGRLTLVYLMGMQLGISKRDVLHTLRFKQFDYWLCPLPWLAEQVKKYTRFPHHRIVVFPLGLNLESFSAMPSQLNAREKLQLPEKLFLFGIIGRLHPKKGQHTLIEAFSLLENKENVGLVILGEQTRDEEGNYNDELLRMVNEYQLNEQVFFRPFRKEVVDFYAAIDVLVMASESETFGMVTIEALAAGKPVIGTNTGGTPELFEQGKWGKLFTPYNANDLKEQMQLQLNEKPLSKTTLKAAAKKYDHTVFCERLEKILDL